MTAASQLVLMGLGHRSLSLDWDPDLVEAIRPGQSVIQIYRGEVLDDAWVVLVKDPREDGIALDGVGLDWFLGLDTEGPLISDAEYLACNDKLANGGFELGDLYWRLAEETAWRVATTSTYVGGTPRSGQWFASLALDPVDEDYLPLDDDLIDSDEPVRVLSGQQFAALAYAKRFAGSVGRIRLRALLSGRVVHPNVLPGLLAGWTDTSEFPTDCDIDGVTGLATIGPTTRKQVVPNPGFETGDFTDWDGDFTDLTVTTAGLNYEGNHAAQYDGYVGGGGGDIWTEAFPVKPKERWKLDAYSIVWGTPDPDQSVGGTLITIAPQDFDTFRASDPTPYLYISEAGLDQNDLLNAWKHFEHEFEIGEDVATMWLDLHFYGIEDPALIQVWDAITLTRIKGNRCALESPVFAVTPKRSYSGTVTAEMPVTLIDGTLRVIARYSAEGRADVLEDLASLDAAPGETKILNYTVRPPSGYDECVIILAGEDVEGDSFTNVTVSDLVDTDDSSRVVEVKSPETQSSYVALPLTVAIPDGIEEMRLQVVAESQSAGWQVDDVSVVRSDGAPSTVAAVATALLSDAETSLALLLPGTIEGPEVLSYDWHIVNEHNLRALFDLLQGGVSPTLSEYRINPDFTVDVGADLFEDRTDLVFAASDLEVLDPPDITQNATNRATHILVIGATRRKANGDSFTIFAEAEVPWPEPVLDAFGNPARRVRRVEDSTINHRLYAEAYATYLAEREAATPKACRLRLSDTRAKGDGRTIKAGELIYVHEPASGLEDPTNTQIAADGSVIFPERIRVMSVSTSYGPGYRAVLRQPGGSETNLAGAQWDTDTSIVLELGAFRPDLVINDGTGSTWPRFLRLRGSQPR